MEFTENSNSRNHYAAALQNVDGRTWKLELHMRSSIECNVHEIVFICVCDCESLRVYIIFSPWIANRNKPKSSLDHPMILMNEILGRGGCFRERRPVEGIRYYKIKWIFGKQLKKQVLHRNDGKRLSLIDSAVCH